MAYGTNYYVPFRRRRDGKTNYRKRTGLVSGDRPRMVVRKTNRHIIVQLVTAAMEGDYTLVAANSKELVQYGYAGGLSSTPAAYLTGMLFAVRALNADNNAAVLDIGLHRAKKGARVFAALKGAVEAGLDVPHGEDILPSEERIRGEHIAAYAPERAANLVANVKETADAIMRELK